MTQRPSIRLLILLLSAVIALSALGGAAAAAIQSPAILFMVALELCVLMCAVFGVMIGRGAFVRGRALALLCIGAGIVVGTELGTRGATGGEGRAIAGVSLTPLVFGRFAAASVFFLLAALEVLMRRPRESVQRLAIGAAFALPVIGIGALVLLPGVQNAVGAMDGVLQLAIAIFGFIVFCGLTAAAGHYLVTAFTLGVEAGERETTSAA